MKKNKTLIIIIFPYLFIHQKEGITIDGLNIKPSFSDCINSEEGDSKIHLMNIARLFRFGNNRTIYQWSYLITHIKNKKEWENLKIKLGKFATVLRYMKLQDINGQANFSHFNYFSFEIAGGSGILGHDSVYYRGVLNGNTGIDFRLNLKEDTATRPYIPAEETYPLVISANDKNNDFFQKFYSDSKLLFKNNEELKILRSIEWFNRSFSHNATGLDPSEAIINVHIAFESLLRPDDEKRDVESQLKTALFNLLGHNEEIGKWSKDFWLLRNKIVHGLNIQSFLYSNPRSKSKKGHRRHIDIARDIFVKCLTIIIKIRSDLPSFGLEEQLVSNEIRIENAIKLLKGKGRKNLNELSKGGVFRMISDLNDDLSGNKQDIKKLGELILSLVKKTLEDVIGRNDNSESIAIINKVLGWTDEDLSGLAMLYSKLEDYSPIFREDIEILTKNIGILSLGNALYNFCRFATRRLLVF